MKKEVKKSEKRTINKQKGKKLLKKTEKESHEEDKKGQGRSTKYKKEYDKLGYKLALLGATDKQIADAFEVTEQTVNNWKTAFPTFFESLKKGKEQADAEVADSLYHSAKGYEHKAVKFFYDSKLGKVVSKTYTEHYPPHPTSMIFWLKNRQPENWRDVKNIDVTKNKSKYRDKLENMTNEELQAEMEKLEKESNASNN
jgi:hypothetical protein